MLEQQFAAIMQELGEIKGELRGMRGTLSRLRGDHENIEDRVRFLENWRWYVLGIAAAAGSAAAVVMSVLTR